MPLPNVFETDAGGMLPLDGLPTVRRRGAWSPRAEWLLEWLLADLVALTGDGRQAQVPLTIDIRRAVDGPPGLHDDESYRLAVADGITIEAATTTGLARAAASLLQLVEPAPGGHALPRVHIDDAPRWPWRGLMLDVARHWIEPDTLQRTLRAMALVKLNVLHLHLSDDQAFRFECRGHPRLAAAGSNGRYYRQSQLAALVDTAAQLGIRVVPEIDMPGHVTSWLVGQPELASDSPPAAPSSAFGVHRAALDASRESTYGFIAELLDELTAVFPDRYVHVGGDEVHPRAWEAPAVRERMRASGFSTTAALQAHFNRRVAEMLAARGRTPIGWDEVLHDDLPDAFVVQSWRGAQAIGAVAARAHAQVASSGLYLDLGMTAAEHCRFDAALPTAELMQREAQWGAGWRMQPMADAYAAFLSTTRAALDAPVDARDRLLGAEACLWSELVTDELLDLRLWERLPAVAGLMWSARSADTTDLDARLDTVVRRLEVLGHVTPRGSRTRLLQRLGVADPTALQPLLDALAPLPWYGRHLGQRVLADRAAGGVEATDARDSRRPYAVTTPLNRIVDLLAVDPVVARGHAAHIQDAALRSRLVDSWHAQPGIVRRLVDAAPALAEIVPLAERLGRLADFLALDPAGADLAAWRAWREAARAPVAELQLVALDIVDAWLGTTGE